jgi:hypothetical protein
MHYQANKKANKKPKKLQNEKNRFIRHYNNFIDVL